MPTVEELKAAWEQSCAKSKANDAARADIHKQIADLKATVDRLEEDARRLWGEQQYAKLTYDKARMPTVREARFLREAAQEGGREYRPYTGSWGNERRAKMAAFAELIVQLGWVKVAGDRWTKKATITEEGQAKLDEYEASKAKPKKKATK